MQTLRKLPMRSPKRNARASNMEDPSVDGDCVIDHSFHGEPFFYGTAGVAGDAGGFGGVGFETADAVGDGLGLVFDEHAVDAVLYGFGQAADAAGDDRHSGRHGEERAGSQALGVGQVDEDFGVEKVL